MATVANDRIVDKDDLLLVTGATGFIGGRLVARLVEHGFRNLRCLVRAGSRRANLDAIVRPDACRIEVLEGTLLSPEDCLRATRNAAVVFHLAAGRGEKSYPDAFLNSVVTTRNLLEASMRHNCLRRFVNVSSFAVYTNRGKPARRLLDESCPVEPHPELRDPYCFAKAKQDELVTEYGERFGIPYVIVRPGHVYGPGNEGISGRVGIGTFGIFLHLGGPNPIPLTYVDNCADAIALTGLRTGTEREVFNVVDDDLPSSNEFMRLYKRHVGRFPSIYVPHALSYVLCSLWEKYSQWSEGQLPPAFNRRRWHANWKRTKYSNAKLKSAVGWTPAVPTSEALGRYFESCRIAKRYA
jgi:nucleoside-diphosphate-sugar epimerase